MNALAELEPIMNTYQNPDNFVIRRGDIWLCDLQGSLGAEQSGIRYILVSSNDLGNRYSPAIIGFPISSSMTKAKLPTHVEIPLGNGLPKPSIIMMEQPRTIDKYRLISFKTKLNNTYMQKVNDAVLVSHGLLH